MKDKSIEELLLEHYKSIASRNHFRNEILSRFAELEQYKTAFEPLWEFCVEERKNKIALELKIVELEKSYENDTGDLISKIVDRDTRISELEKEVENLNQEIIEMRGIYCSECGACGESGCCPPERCKELDTHLKCLYGIGYAKEYKELLDENNKLEKEVERLKNPIIESLHYDQNGLDIWASHPIIQVLAEETVRLLKLSNAENFVVVSLYDKERNGYTLTIKKNNGKSIEEKYEEVSKEVENLKCCGNCGEANGIYDCRMKPIEFYKCDSWISHKTIFEKQSDNKEDRG